MGSIPTYIPIYVAFTYCNLFISSHAFVLSCSLLHFSQLSFSMRAHLALSLSLPVSVSLSLSLSLYLSFFRCLYLSIYIFIYLSLYMYRYCFFFIFSLLILRASSCFSIRNLTVLAKGSIPIYVSFMHLNLFIYFHAFF